MKSNRLTVLSVRIADAMRKQPGLRRVLSNTAWMYADRILRMMVGPGGFWYPAKCAF